jgi:hypothetical protein
MMKYNFPGTGNNVYNGDYMIRWKTLILLMISAYWHKVLKIWKQS